METRVQKILAQAGYGSRRSCEKLIINKRVSVNGSTATLGMKADPDFDHILVDILIQGDIIALSIFPYAHQGKGQCLFES